MAKVFDKLASLAGFTTEDFAELFAGINDWTQGEIGAALGYLLGRLDGADAAAFVAAVRATHPPHDVKLTGGRKSVNIVGTGGGPSTFNITTTTTFVVAAAGAVVVKTGSAACRSKSGYADVAAKLGTVKVSMPWEQIDAIANDIGIVFVPPSCHAPILGRMEYRLTTPAHRNAAAYLNKIGPLLSPVKVDYRFIGAHSPRCQSMLVDACRILGDAPTTLVSAQDGMDEISTRANSAVVHLAADGSRRDETMNPRALGIMPPAADALQGYEPAAAAECCQRILGGLGTAAQTEIVALNAAVVLSSVGMYGDSSTAFQAALDLLKSGAALGKLRALRERVWKCAAR